MDIKEILNTIEISEEQAAALDDFFKQHNENIRQKAVEEYIESNTDSEKDAEIIRLKDEIKFHKIAFKLFEEDCNAAFDKFEDDCDYAFQLFEDDCDAAFDKFENDVDKAFTLYEEDVQNEFTAKMVEALDSLYPDLTEKAKKEFFESSEFTAFVKIKDIIAPYMEGANKELLAKVNELESHITMEKQKNEDLSRKSMIDTFIEDIPEKHVNKAKAFLEESKDEQDMLNRYELFLSYLEDVVDDPDDKKIPNVRRKRPDDLEKKRIYLENLDKDEELTDPVLESQSVNDTTINNKKDERLKAFKPVHQQILAAAGLIEI